MKVVVVEKIEHHACYETFTAQVGTVALSMSDRLYHCFTTILGVYASADMAKEALENERKELLEQYGEKVLDDENIDPDDKHTYFTFSVKFLELKGISEKEGDTK